MFAAHVSGRGLSSSGSQSSLRGSFPECILEDSGFEEPQEFRTRCSSLAGSLQRKPGEGVIMGPMRRRHSSAPNHVQPSDADKNRTMLFQVEKPGSKYGILMTVGTCCTLSATVTSDVSYLWVQLTVGALRSCINTAVLSYWNLWLKIHKCLKRTNRSVVFRLYS